MRRIDHIIIHCSATPCNSPLTVTALIRDHQDRFGFTAYHYYITLSGCVYQTRHLQLPGAHAPGYDAHAIGICCEGGLDPRGHPADTRTPQQRHSLRTLLTQLKAQHPQALILSHRDLPNATDTCPSFSCDEYKDLG